MQQRQGVSNGQRAQDNFECAFKLVCVLKYMAFLMAQRQRICLQEIQETQVQSLGWENHLESEMATYSCILAWEIPWTEGAWWATVHGVTKCWTQLNN